MLRFLTLAVVLVLAVAATALARGNIGDVGVSKDRDGPWGNDFVHIQVNDDPKRVFMRAKSDTTQNQSAELEDNSSDPSDDFKIRWFRRDNNISQAVKGDGFEFNLKPEKAKRFRVRVIPKVNNPGTACVVGEFTFAGTEENNGLATVNDPNICG